MLYYVMVSELSTTALGNLFVATESIEFISPLSYTQAISGPLFEAIEFMQYESMEVTLVSHADSVDFMSLMTKCSS